MIKLIEKASINSQILWEYLTNSSSFTSFKRELEKKLLAVNGIDCFPVLMWETIDSDDGFLESNHRIRPRPDRGMQVGKLKIKEDCVLLSTDVFTFRWREDTVGRVKLVLRSMYSFEDIPCPSLEEILVLPLVDKLKEQREENKTLFTKIEELKQENNDKMERLKQKINKRNRRCKRLRKRIKKILKCVQTR